MDRLPTFDARERLLDALGVVGRRVSWDAFVSAPLLTPEPKWFPDAWSPDRAGVRRLATRLLRYAGLGHRVSVAIEAPPEEHAAAWFEGIDDARCWFGIDPAQLEQEDGFVAALCHETGHAFRRHHGIELGNRDREEEATDLTAVFLGFGVLALNATDLFETSGHIEGASTVTRTRHLRLGYLSTASLAYLLAVQITVRGTPKAEIARLAAHLRPNQRACFDAAMDHLKDDASFLHERLALPDRATWLAPRTRPLTGDLEDDDDDEIDEIDDEPVAKPNDGAIGCRITVTAAGRRAAQLGVGSLLLSLPLAFNIAAFGQTVVIMGAASIFMVLGYVIGDRQRTSTCTLCDSVVLSTDTACDTCGGSIVADVATGDERLVLEDMIETKGVTKGIAAFEEDQRMRAKTRWRTLARNGAIALVVVAVVSLLVLSNR